MYLCQRDIQVNIDYIIILCSLIVSFFWPEMLQLLRVIIGILCIIDLHFISEKPCLDTKLLGEKNSMWIKVANS
jgi:hypothetical protein